MIPKRSLYQIARALEGVAILGVLPGTPAAQAGVRYGDVLLEVNGRRVKSFEDYVDAKGLRDDGMDLVVFRSGTETLTSLRYDPSRGVPVIEEIVASLDLARLGVGVVAEEEGALS